MKNTRCSLLLLLALTAACGGTERDRPGDPSVSDVPTDRFTASLDQVSSTNDCDPEPGNPGEFTASLEIYTRADETAEWDRAAVTTPRELVLNAEYGALNSSLVNESAWVDVPRRDGQEILVAIHVAELDDNGADASLDGYTQYVYDAYLGCWWSGDNRRCNGGRFEVARTYREDYFDLFNPNDEGCQIGAVWSTSLTLR